MGLLLCLSWILIVCLLVLDEVASLPGYWFSLFSCFLDSLVWILFWFCFYDCVVAVLWHLIVFHLLLICWFIASCCLLWFCLDVYLFVWIWFEIVDFAVIMLVVFICFTVGLTNIDFICLWVEVCVGYLLLTNKLFCLLGGCYVNGLLFVFGFGWLLFWCFAANLLTASYFCLWVCCLVGFVFVLFSNLLCCDVLPSCWFWFPEWLVAALVCLLCVGFCAVYLFFLVVCWSYTCRGVSACLGTCFVVLNMIVRVWVII